MDTLTTVDAWVIGAWREDRVVTLPMLKMLDGAWHVQPVITMFDYGTHLPTGMLVLRISELRDDLPIYDWHPVKVEVPVDEGLTGA